jgi:pimeloyl-ACP methyl ester carboxylesterase
MARRTASLGSTPGPYDLPAAARELSATSADGARLHVEVHGHEQDPAVVLIHGWTCQVAFWAPVIRELTATGHRVIAYDQRGHGRTPAADPHAYSPALLADDLCAVLDAALAPGEQAVLGGHSMGAMTLVAAARHRELERRAAALMLCSTGMRRLVAEGRVVRFRSRSARIRTQRFIVRSRLPMGPITPLSKRLLKYGTLGPDATPEQITAVARLVHACPARVRGSWGAMLADLDIAANARAIAAPTAVVLGTHDRLTPPVLGRELAETLPHCTGLHELPRRGHMTPIESPEVVTGVLRDLVRDHLAPASVAENVVENASEKVAEKAAKKKEMEETREP